MSSSITAIATSGLQAAQRQLQSSAHNVANLQTEGFARQQVRQEARADGAGVDAAVTRAPQRGAALERDVVDQLAARQAFGANLAVFRTGEQLLGHLLDEHG